MTVNAWKKRWASCDGKNIGSIGMAVSSIGGSNRKLQIKVALAYGPIRVQATDMSLSHPHRQTVRPFPGLDEREPVSFPELLCDFDCRVGSISRLEPFWAFKTCRSLSCSDKNDVGPEKRGVSALAQCRLW
jgi:hypothetical protein